MTLKIKKGTYGSYEKSCIWMTDTEVHCNEFALYCQMDDFSKDVINKILARLEYFVKHNIPIEIDGFRTNKELYPEG